MTQLPILVQRTPGFFYAAAVLYFIGYVVLTHLQMGAAQQHADGGWDSYSRLAVLSGWLQAFEGAVYLVANGVIAHILLAIWRNGRGSAGGGSE